MKFTTTKKNIIAAILNTERCTGKQITLPILQSVFFEITKNICALKATNLEIGIKNLFPCKADEDGVVAVSPRLLLGILQNTQEESVLFEVKQGVLFVKTKTVNAKLNTVLSDEFPIIPKITPTQSCVISKNIFINALEQVLPAVSVSDFKPEISGVYFSISGKNMLCAATDTFRLAEKKIILTKEASGAFSCIIPFKMAQEVVRTLRGVDGVDEIKVGVGDNQFLIIWDGSRLISRVIDGNFPEYKTIIPNNFNTNFIIPHEAILQKVRLANVLTGKLNDVVLKTKKTEISVLSVNPELGAIDSSFATPVRGEDVMVTLNARYFADGITSCGGENIFIGLNNEQSPVLLRNPEDETFLYIVMPIRNTP